MKRATTRRIRQLRGWIDRHRIATMLISGALAIAVVGGTAMAILSRPAPVASPSLPPPKPKPVYYSPLTGLKVKEEKDTTKPITAVIIENSLEARPQSGLKESEVVFEAIANGGITRFMALYQQNKPSLIGPVRSVRSYHPDWVRPFDASIAHVGGSAKALKEIRNGTFRDIDQFFNAGSYWRATDRYAPHNVYTSAKRLDALNKQKGYKTSSPKPFERADAKPAKNPNARKITITVSSTPYDSSYAYSKKTNTYARSQGGALHKDREKGVIKPTVVIALKVDEQTVMEDTWQERITTLGKGSAVIFQNGTATKATWKKPSARSQLTFYDKKGEKIALARGQTWITAVPNGRGSVSWR